MFVFSLLIVATGRLLKVAVLARHGNRAPNPQMPYICPKGKDVMDQFHEPIGAKLRAALSRVGMAENLESGTYLRKKYIGKGKLLEDETYYDNGSTFFFSERMNRNIVSTVAITRGMYPDGSGQRGFAESNPNLVPILTSQPFEDTLMNLPRDGPCKKRYNVDRQDWTVRHESEVFQENGELLSELGNACGFNYSKSHEITGKSLIWTLKATADLFSFANNEGIALDASFPPDLRTRVTTLAKRLVNQQRFEKPHQITYWIGRFLEDAIFANLRDPADAKKKKYGVAGMKTSSKAPWIDTPEEWYDQNKFLLFLNHRELLISVLTVFKLNDVLEHTPPAGSMLIWEVHEDENGKFVRLLFWTPSQPSWEKKHERLTSQEPVSDLYSTGSEKEVYPEVCATKGRCTLEELENAYAAWIEKTGSWAKVCGLSDTMYVNSFLKKTEISADDGDDEDGWRTAFEKRVFGLAGKLQSGTANGVGIITVVVFVLLAGFLCVALPTWNDRREDDIPYFLV